MLDRSCGQSAFNFGYAFNDLEKVGQEEKIENLIMCLFIIMIYETNEIDARVSIL